MPTKLDQVDTFVGDGITTAFTLVNKLGLRTASVASIDGVVSYANIGFTVSGNVITFTTPPAADSAIIVPGISGLQIAAYDNTVNDNPQVVQVPFYLVDTDTIALYAYTGQPLIGSIELSFTQEDTDGLPLSAIQLAPSLADGTIGALGAAGDPLTTGDISAATQIQNSNSPIAMDITVLNPTGFLEGDYIQISSGNPNQELVRILGITGNVFSISGTEFSHNSGESVLVCGRKFFLQVSIPTNFTLGEQALFLNLCPTQKSKEVSRF